MSPLEYRNCRSLVVGLSCHLQIGFRLFQLSCIQIGTGHGSHKLHIFFVLALQQFSAASEACSDSSLSDFLLYPPPACHSGTGVCAASVPANSIAPKQNTNLRFMLAFIFSYSSLTFTTRTGWVAGTNPDFNIIRCPPVGSEERGKSPRKCAPRIIQQGIDAACQRIITVIQIRDRVLRLLSGMALSAALTDISRTSFY